MAKPRENNNNYTLQVNFGRRRKTLTLGHVSKQDANLFAANIDKLVSHKKRYDTTPIELESWIGSLSQTHRQQLSDLNLIDKFDSSLTVGGLIDAFLADYRNSGKTPLTVKQFETAMRVRVPRKLKQQLVSFLSPQPLSSKPNAEAIFSDQAKAIFRDAESWQRNHYAKSTWSRTNGRLREVGSWAIGRGICDHNLFALMPRPGEVNADRNQHVEHETVIDVMDFCLDSDTRLVFALGRFAGLRLPSEARTIKRSDVDFEKRQLRILDSKKKEYRTMPLFDEVQSAIEHHLASTPPSRWLMSDRFRGSSDANNYGLMHEAVCRSPHQPWVKLRQNLRSSCENDLLQIFEERLVTLWLGHTIKVSRRHYQKQKDSDILRAVERSRAQK